MERRDFLKQIAAGTGLLVSSSYCPAHVPQIAFTEKDSAHAASAMALAGETFLKSLSPEKRELANLPFENEQRQDWDYVPRPRKGISYKQLDQEQIQLASALLHAGLSQQGFQNVSAIRSLETILREIEGASERDPELYYFRIFGAPNSSKPWAWSMEGHHISLNYTLLDSSTVASTPMFLGAHPAEVQHGSRKGQRTLSSEEDTARKLLKSLDEKQRAQAIVSQSAPSDILSGNSRKVDPIKPAGLQAFSLSGQQKDILMSLLKEYAGNMAPDIAAARMEKLRAAGFNNIHFAWAGGFEHGQPHYYRIQGPSFLVEYDNIQDDANHIHSVWRDFHGDFGADLLAEHYRTARH
jgi:uncharacterized protein DUF3500